MKGLRLGGLILGIALLNVVVLSPGFLGVVIGGSAFETALGVTLLFVSLLVIIFASYLLLFKPATVIPIKEIKTHEDYAAGLSHYRNVKVLEDDIALAQEQLDRLRKKKGTLTEVLDQRFDPAELSYKKFMSAIQEVEKLFYLNIRNILNRLNVFDAAEFSRAANPKTSRFSRDIVQEQASIYNEYLSFVKSSLGVNEEILLKLDKLLLEISRLDSVDLEDISAMPCLQEIDALIKQTKYYKS